MPRYDTRKGTKTLKKIEEKLVKNQRLSSIGSGKTSGLLPIDV